MSGAVAVSVGDGEPSVVLTDQVSVFREPMPWGCALHQYFSFFVSAPVRRDGCIRLVLGTVIPQRQRGVGSCHCDRVSILMKKPHEFLFLTSQCMRKLYYAIALVIYWI